MTLRSVWLENKYEHILISAQCILTGKHGCRRSGSMAKRIVNFISDAIFFSRQQRNRWMFNSDKVTVRLETNTLWSDKLLTSIPPGSDRMSDGFLATSDNFTNGSDNVRDRPIF